MLTASGLKASPSSDMTSAGFFGSERPAPDLSIIPAALHSRLQGLRVPQPLLEQRAGDLSAAKARAKSARTDSASFEHRLLERTSLGATLADLEQMATIGPRQYLERQLRPEEIDDFGLEEQLAEALPTLDMTPFERLLAFHEEPEVPIYELWLATLFRSVYSPRQLLERMVIFWTDHFNVSILSDLGPWLKPTDDSDVIRRHALGKFPDLLRASAHSAAMLSYLTNDSNIKDHPNENYARELMELHTLGVDGGYSEQDVKEVARCLTGWRFRPYQEGPPFGDFVFDPTEHDNGAKTVLGHGIPAGGGASDGETVISILASHPSTARFVSHKLLKYFWGYEPGERAIDRIAGIYDATGGDLPAMLRGILSWGQLATATPKLKRPYHLVISAVRGLFAEIENPFFLLGAMDQAGQLPFTWAPPNGFPDSLGYWAGLVLPRWNFASLALSAEQAGVRIDLPFLDPELPAEELRLLLDFLLLGGTMSPETGDAVRGFLQSRPKTTASVNEAIGLVLSSPEFQSY